VQYASTVVICEGEKDCDALNGLSLYDDNGGHVMGTTSGGAESWNDVLADDLRDKRIVILPDADDAGERYADQIQRSLQVRGIDHRLVSLVGTGAKDISDFIAAGGTAGDIVPGSLGMAG
jgi:5S rRNA maturation endonuclease (ribonuclease M5)